MSAGRILLLVLAAGAGFALAAAGTRMATDAPTPTLPTPSPMPVPPSLSALSDRIVGGVAAPVLHLRPAGAIAAAVTPPPARGVLTAWTAQTLLTGTGALLRVQVPYHRTDAGWLLDPDRSPVLWTPTATAALAADPAAHRLLQTALRELAAWSASDPDAWVDLEVPGGALAVPAQRIADGTYTASMDQGVDERRVLPGSIWTLRRVVPDQDRLHTFAMLITSDTP